MEIRRVAGRDEVRDIIRIDALAWREAYDDILPPEIVEAQPVAPTERDVDRWMEEGVRGNRDGILLTVTVDETVRGYADFRWGAGNTKDFVGQGEAGLKAIYVHPDHWGEGLGTALLRRGIEILPEWVDTLRLEMFAENDLAREFYEARGFEETGLGEYEIAGEAYPTAVYTLEF